MTAVSRRTFLGSGAALGAAAAGAYFLGGTAAASGSEPVFDVGRTPQKVFSAAKLNNPHESWQSIAWDAKHGRIFYAVPPRDPHVQAAKGNIRIAPLTVHGKAPAGSGHMDFEHFTNGHGIGVDYVGDQVYLWMSTDDDEALCRVKWTGTGKYTTSDVGTTELPGSFRFRPVTGATGYTCATNYGANRMLVRYNPPGAAYTTYAVYDMQHARSNRSVRVPGTLRIAESRIVAGIHEPSYEPRDPKHPKQAKAPNFQGMALYGDYAYVLTGHQWQSDPTTEECADIQHRRGDVHLTRVNMRSGAIKHSPVILADRDIHNREPEGVAVIETSKGVALTFGLLSIPVCHPNDDRFMDALGIYA